MRAPTIAHALRFGALLPTLLLVEGWPVIDGPRVPIGALVCVAASTLAIVIGAKKKKLGAAVFIAILAPVLTFSVIYLVESQRGSDPRYMLEWQIDHSIAFYAMSLADLPFAAAQWMEKQRPNTRSVRLLGLSCVALVIASLFATSGPSSHLGYEMLFATGTHHHDPSSELWTIMRPAWLGVIAAASACLVVFADRFSAPAHELSR